MCHAFLTDNVYQLLFQIDQSIAEEVREHGCDCGGMLHAAPYPRKPRGIRSALEEASYESRLSFCCSQDGCRRRSTDQQTMHHEISAWLQRRNAKADNVNWRFTTDDARIKLRRQYPSIED